MYITPNTSVTISYAVLLLYWANNTTQSTPQQCQTLHSNPNPKPFPWPFAIHYLIHIVHSQIVLQEINIIMQGLLCVKKSPTQSILGIDPPFSLSYPFLYVPYCLGRPNELFMLVVRWSRLWTRVMAALCFNN